MQRALKGVHGLVSPHRLGARATFGLPSEDKGNALKLRSCSRPSQVLS